VTGRLRQLRDEWRPSAITLGAPVFPLAVLFGLNAVDELDRSAFAVLLPDIRDHFGLSDAAALALVAATTIAVLLVEIPLSFAADRHSRVRMATIGAAAWALFSFGTGLATGIATLAAMRVGAGLGKAVVTPTHSSLLADYYAPEARVKVFSAHRLASSTGQIIAPLLAGSLAMWLGWRAPFLLFAIPSVVLVLLAARLREPVRGFHERRAAGADDAAALIEQPAVSARAAVRELRGIRTIRRIWFAAPFLAIALFGIPTLLSLVYEDVFGLNAGRRGLIATAIEPLQIVGVVVAMPTMSRLAERGAGSLVKFVALVGVIDGVLVAALAYAPHVSLAVGLHAALAASVGTLVPAFLALVSLVAPPHVRAATFSTISVAALPGIAVFLPALGAASDAVGLQASMLMLVPTCVIGALILASAAKIVDDDIAEVRRSSLTGPNGPTVVADGVATVV
jgi:branched-chain amino acid transport system ATP-binding protein